MTTVLCDNSGCQVELPNSHFATVNTEDYTRRISGDCSRGLVLYTDDPGLVDQQVPASGPYLGTAQNMRKQNVFSIQDVIDHWDPGSRTYQELWWFFRANSQKGFRPRNITVAFMDLAGGETLETAHVELLKCFCCFRWVTHVSHDVNDAALHDLAIQNSFGALLATERRIGMFPTADEATLAGSNTEIGSIPGQAGNTDIPVGYFLMWQDANCLWQWTDATNTVQTKPWFEPNHIMGASIGASYGFNDQEYNFTIFQKPPRRGWPGAHASKLSQSEVINVTGVHPQTGTLLDTERSVNVYVKSKAQTLGFIEGMLANKEFIDQRAKRYAVEEDLENALVLFIGDQTDAMKMIDENDLASMDTLMMAKVREYIGKDIFPNRLPQNIQDNIDELTEYQWSTKFENIIDGGDGYAWVLARQPLNQMTLADQAQRLGPEYTLCFIPNQPMHRPRVTICNVLRPDQIAT